MDEAARRVELRKAVGGDADALQRLLIHYHPTVSRFVASRLPKKLQRHLDPEDVLQQTYIAAFGNIRGCSFDGPGGFFKWLEAIALEKLETTQRDLRRQKRDITREYHPDSFGSGKGRLAGWASDSSYPDLFARLAGSDSTPSRRLARQEAAAALLSSLARLTDDQRTVIRLRFLEDRPIEEIAATLRKSEDAIYMLCHRGLKALHAMLGSISRYSLKS